MRSVVLPDILLTKNVGYDYDYSLKCRLCIRDCKLVTLSQVSLNFTLVPKLDEHIFTLTNRVEKLNSSGPILAPRPIDIRDILGPK